MEQIPKTIDELKQKIHISLSNNESVSAIYTSYVRPFCEAYGSYSNLLLENNDLIQIPPTIHKVKAVLLQVAVMFSVFRQNKNMIEDPLPENEYRQILSTIKLILPLAMAIDTSIVPMMLEELNYIHSDYQKTILKLSFDLGINHMEPPDDYEVNDQIMVKRVHYRDPKKEIAHNNPQKQNVLNSLIAKSNHSVLNVQGSFLNRTVKIRIKKPKHGPKTKSKPLFK